MLHWLICAVTLAAFPVLAAVSVPLTWNPSVDSNAAGYKIYYGVASGVYANSVDVGNVTNAAIAGLSGNTTYYFAATTYDVSGDESDFSNEAKIGTASASQPTLNPISNISIIENAGTQTLGLSGISSGITTGKQTIKITATSSDVSLIPTPKTSYTGANTTGTLTFSPKKNATGTATITVTINNGQTASNTVSQTFAVTVYAVTIPPTLNPIGNLSITENAGEQTVSLSGISPGSSTNTKKPKLKITATSSNTALIKKSTVKYKSPETIGTLTFEPVKNASGTATVTVTANNGEAIDNLATQTFTVTVLAPSTTPQVAISLPAPAVLTPAVHVDGQFAFSVSGVTNYQYVVQASTNLVDWVSVQTNTAPFTFVDPNASQFSRRFYRTVNSP